VDLVKGDYASTIVMLATKDIFGNWTKQHVWGLSPSQQAHVFGQVCCAFIKKNL
jgi:hypothetical protein